MCSRSARHFCAVIAQIMAEETQRHGGNDVEHGVLLHEHGRDTDEQCGNDRKKLKPRPLKPAAVEQSEHRGNRAENVYRRADVRVRIKAVKPADESCQHIVTREHLRPQLLTGRKQQVDDHRDCICADDKAHHFLKRRNVEEKCIHQCADQVHKPEQIRDEEPLAERYDVVKRAVHHMVRADLVKPLDE